jgi:hypothetical protein
MSNYSLEQRTAIAAMQAAAAAKNYELAVEIRERCDLLVCVHCGFYVFHESSLFCDTCSISGAFTVRAAL